MPDRNIINSISSHYSFQVLRAFNNNIQSIKSIETIAKSLNEIYRYFEPAFFTGKFFVCKHFGNELCLNEKTSAILYDKNILLNKTTGTVIIQVFDDGKLLLWENESVDSLKDRANTLIYLFKNNKEYFLANESQIDITIYSEGSRFSTQFVDLLMALSEYAVNKIFQSSCSHFSKSWYDDKRIFFKGGGRGSNIPEKFMQQSLYEFLNTYMLRGITIEAIREFNVNGNNPKPVDIKIHWKEANRVALIEVKFLGTVKGTDGKISYKHDNPRANAGIVQLKGYFDSATSDCPTTIMKSYLLVIDGRRNNIDNSTVSVSYADGMYFKDMEIEIDEDKRFYESIIGFEKPIRIFSAPICS